MVKPWGSKRNIVNRNGIKKKRKPPILIVCEGEKTEKLYFEAFRVTSVVTHVVGKGFNTLSLVKEAIRIRDEAKDDGIHYTKVWCVFDKDSFSADSVNAAHALAKKSKIETAYSNEAFELWFLLHFSYFNTGLSRSEYKHKLPQLLGLSYEKNLNNMYLMLLSRQQVAIKNAERLALQYASPNFPGDNPFTQVHLLVKQLNKYIK